MAQFGFLVKVTLLSMAIMSWISVRAQTLDIVIEPIGDSWVVNGHSAKLAMKVVSPGTIDNSCTEESCSGSFPVNLSQMNKLTITFSAGDGKEMLFEDLTTPSHGFFSFLVCKSVMSVTMPIV